jgi:hypothetical protein
MSPQRDGVSSTNENFFGEVDYEDLRFLDVATDSTKQAATSSAQGTNQIGQAHIALGVSRGSAGTGLHLCHRI